MVSSYYLRTLGELDVTLSTELKLNVLSFSFISPRRLDAWPVKGVFIIDLVDSECPKRVFFAGDFLIYVEKQYESYDVLALETVVKPELRVNLVLLSYFGNLNIRLPASD